MTVISSLLIRVLWRDSYSNVAFCRHRNFWPVLLGVLILMETRDYAPKNSSMEFNLLFPSLNYHFSNLNSVCKIRSRSRMKKKTAKHNSEEIRDQNHLRRLDQQIINLNHHTSINHFRRPKFKSLSKQKTCLILFLKFKLVPSLASSHY